MANYTSVLPPKRMAHDAIKKMYEEMMRKESIETLETATRLFQMFTYQEIIEILHTEYEKRYLKRKEKIKK